MQTQIGLLLQEQSDQGLHCLPFYLHLLGCITVNCKNPDCSVFRAVTISVVSVLSSRAFMVP